MPILRDIDDHVFTPRTSLEAWLRTYKRPYSVAGMQFPGLYNTDKAAFHFGMFMLALFIEVTGTLVLALPMGAGLGIVGAVIGSVGFILDFGIAFALLFLNRNLSYFSNLRILYDSDNRSISKIDGIMNGIKSLKNAGYFVILLVAGVKIYFLKEGFGVLEMPVFVMAFLFVSAAVIHIKYTEYFFAFGLFLVSASSERKASRIDGVIKPDLHEIYTTNALKSFEAIPRKCPHFINPTNELVKITLSTGVVEERYKTEVGIYGFITDRDLETLCDTQPIAAQKRDLAVELLFLQLGDTAPSEKYTNLPVPLHRTQPPIKA